MTDVDISSDLVDEQSNVGYLQSTMSWAKSNQQLILGLIILLVIGYIYYYYNKYKY